MSNISQFFKGDTRKKNRKIFAGNQSVIWTAPPNASEVDVHVWGGGGHGSSGGPGNGEGQAGGGGGGYTGNTFIVGAGTTIGVSVGATAGTSTATITNPIGVSTLTSTGGNPGNPSSPNRGEGGAGSYNLHPSEPTDYIFTANGGDAALYAFPPSAPSPIRTQSWPTGGGGAGFIYGPGGNSGHIPGPLYSPNIYGNPVTPKKAVGCPGGGGFRGHGGFSLGFDPPFANACGGAGGGFMPGSSAGNQDSHRTYVYGGAGISGFSMAPGHRDNLPDVEWFYLEDIQGYGGAGGYDELDGGSPGSGPINYAKNGYAGGGGAGQNSQPQSFSEDRGRMGGGDGGMFGGGGGGNPGGMGGNGGFAGGGGGGRYPTGRGSTQPTSVSGHGGEGIIIIYY